MLAGLAAFIARNLPFVAQVALMGLEMTGLARPNSPLVWAAPADYQRELTEAVDTLSGYLPLLLGARRMRRRLHHKR